MTKTLEQPRGADRRHQPRGGRRAGEPEALAPLVLLVGTNPNLSDQSEAVLARLHFAVATSRSADDALGILPGLRPDIVVADAADAERIRMEAPQLLPVVVMTDEMRQDHQALIEGIRESLRSSRTS